MLSFHYDNLVWPQATLHHSHILHFRTCLDETLFHRRIGLHHEDERAAFLYGNGFRRHCHGIFAHVEQHSHVSELARKKFPLRIRHLCSHGESTRLGIHERVCEIHEALIFVLRFICQCDSHIRIPVTVRILLPEVHVPGLGLLIVEVGHLEFHGHGVALYDIGQKRLRTGTHHL